MIAESMEALFLVTSNSLQLAILTRSNEIYPSQCATHYSFHIYRHSEIMIKRLESAGLGFFVQATETQQKLGMCTILNI